MKKLFLLMSLIVFPMLGANAQSVELEIFTKSEIPFPVELAHNGNDEVFVVNQGGKVFIVDKDGNVSSSPFLDISDRVDFDYGQKGLLGLAFAPDYATSKRLYVYYIDKNNKTVISRFTTTSDTDADESSEKVLITYDQPDNANDHKAGCMKFGPDGYLYIASGDGGKPTQGVNAQDLSKLLGKILRIDVSGDTYSIPDDNPFKDTAGAKGEIWAYGVRNPWKISFDKETGDFWIGDVGADIWDEINFQPASANGGANYGWPCWEAEIVGEFADSKTCPDISETAIPVDTYYQSAKQIKVSVTGGFVYRGSKYPYFKGHYIYAEAYTGKIFALHKENDQWEQIQMGTVDRFIASFGEDKNGELYASAYVVPGYSEIGDLVYKVKLNAPPGTVSIDHAETVKVDFYPNPVESYINIGSEFKFGSYSIQNLQGNQLIKGQFPENGKLNLNSLPSGLYILMLLDQKGGIVTTRKINKI